MTKENINAHRPGTVAHTYSPSMLEAETQDFWEFKASLSYTWSSRSTWTA